MKQLIIDGTDVTAAVSRYENRLIHVESFNRLLRRRGMAVEVLNDLVGVSQKTMWRYTHRQRVIPLATTYRIATVLNAPVDEFTVQSSRAKALARRNTMLWESRHFTDAELLGLIETLSYNLRQRAEKAKALERRRQREAEALSLAGK